MAGSYMHTVNDDGQLVTPEYLAGMLETGGDVYEAIEEFYGMVWYLAKGNPEWVEEARRQYRQGLNLSPGKEG